MTEVKIESTDFPADIAETFNSLELFSGKITKLQTSSVFETCEIMHAEVQGIRKGKIEKLGKLEQYLNLLRTDLPAQVEIPHDDNALKLELMALRIKENEAIEASPALKKALQMYKDAEKSLLAVAEEIRTLKAKCEAKTTLAPDIQEAFNHAQKTFVEIQTVDLVQAREALEKHKSDIAPEIQSQLKVLIEKVRENLYAQNLRRRWVAVFRTETQIIAEKKFLERLAQLEAFLKTELPAKLRQKSLASTASAE